MGQVVIMVAGAYVAPIQKRIRPDVTSTLSVAALHPPLPEQDCCCDPIKSDGSIHSIRKVIHEFQCLPTTGKESTVTTMEQSPAVDTIAVGTDQGNVHLVNLRHDKKLFSLRHQSRDSKVVTIQSISFRTDGSAMYYGIAPMAVALGRYHHHLGPDASVRPRSGMTDIARNGSCSSRRYCQVTHMPQEPCWF
jgi:U3 small nucleolar RNA-associated protein 21